MERSKRLEPGTQENPSTTCALCHGEHRQCSTPSSWKIAEARSYVDGLNVPPDNPVCSACRRDITRVLGESTYIPRWDKTVKATQCSVEQCTQHVFTCLHKVSRAQLSETLETAGLTCNLPNCPLPLCTHHYHMVYKLLKPTASNNCSLCGLSLKNTMAKRCPNPGVIEHHLHDHSEFDGHIDENDRICYTCYRAHLAILQHYETVSLDTDLENVLDMLSKQTTTITNVQEAIDHSMREVVVFVGRQLLKHRAMLLPTIYNMLCQTARDTLQLHNLDSTIKVTSIVSTRWVLSSITAALEGHVQYHCTVRKYGTLIYRQSSDLRTALSHALWTSHHRTPPVETKLELNSPLQQEREVLEALNERVQAQIKTFNGKDLDLISLEHSNFDIETVLIGELIVFSISYISDRHIKKL